MENDIAETLDSIDHYPDIAEKLYKELEKIVSRGTSRKGPVQANDVKVRFDTIQEKRWALR